MLYRGLFRTTYYNTYEAREESDKVAGSMVNTSIMNIHDNNVSGIKPGYDYNVLDEEDLFVKILCYTIRWL